MKIFAHRGASHDAPENTLAAFRLAWEQGADGAELDVHLSSDCKIIVCHDANTKRTTGKDRVIERTKSSELRDLPQLGEVVAEIPDGRGVLVEVKCGLEIMSTLIGAKPPAEKTGFLSFNIEVLSAIKGALPKHRCMLNVEPGEFFAPGLISLCDPKAVKTTRTQMIGRRAPTRAAVRHLEEHMNKLRAGGLWQRPFDGVSLGWHASIDRALVEALHAAGLAVAVWTVDDPRIARLARDANVDILMTNRPGFIKRALET